MESRIVAALGLRRYPAQVIWGESDPVLRARDRKFVQTVLGIDRATLLHAKHFLQEDHAVPIAEAVLALALDN